MKTGGSSIFDAKSGGKFFYHINCIETSKTDHGVCRERGV